MNYRFGRKANKKLKRREYALKRLFKSEEFKIILRHLPTLTLVFIIIFSVFFTHKSTFEGLLLQKPSGIIPVSVFFLLLYIIKSMSYLVPMVVIYVTAGTLLPLPVALSVNTLGAAIVVTIPYWLGYHYGAGFLGTLFSKFPKIESFIKKREANGWIVSCFPRTIVFVPIKTVSVYLGSIKTPYYKYLLGSMLGLMPMLVSVTVIGTNITEPSSPGFIVAAIIIVISAWGSLAAYVLMERRRKRKGNGE